MSKRRQAPPAKLLARVADALNACERAGLQVKLRRDTVITGHGFVFVIGGRWSARKLVPFDGEGR
jgi:hypothetical protein